MIKGSSVALITPFTESDKVDEKRLRSLIDWHIESKTDSIVCCGTTGESPTLSDQEKLDIIKISIGQAKKRIPIVAGTGTYSTQKTIDLTKKAKELGADAALIVVPYYNRPTQEGILYHFKEVAKVGLPVILYHHPGRTGSWISIETFKRLSDVKNIIAIKEASCNFEFIKDLKKEVSLPILSGDDCLTRDIIRVGGVGAISVVSNIIPKAFSEFVKSSLEGKDISLYDPLFKAMTLETNPQPVKYALSLMGRCLKNIRPPLLLPSDENRKRIEAILSDYELV